MNDRNAQRHEARRRRKQAARDEVDAARRLVDRFLSAIPWSEYRLVSGYWPVGSEIDDRPLLRALRTSGLAVALPVVVAPGQPLVFRKWDEHDVLIEGPYAIPQPSEAAPEVDPSLLIVPLLAFDQVGHRLGSGLGFYDRTLEALRRVPGRLAVGVAFAAQRVDRLDALDTDQRLDWVVTEREAVRFV